MMRNRGLNGAALAALLAAAGTPATARGDVVLVGGCRLGRAILERELDRMMTNGNRKPGDPVPAGLYTSGTRRYTADEQLAAERRAAEAERKRWNDQVDAAKATKRQRKWK